MNREVYDKIYIQDDYSRQFSELRDRYHDRTQQALKGRAVDNDQAPNATTVVWMKDTPDGGVTISTGDFVAFYNARHGYDRIGEARRAMAESVHRVELKEKNEAENIRARKAKKKALRPRFSLAYAILSLMLVFSLVSFFGTTAVVKDSKAELRALESELATMEAAQIDSADADTYNLEELARTATLSGEQSVKIPESSEETFTMSALLNALAGLMGE